MHRGTVQALELCHPVLRTFGLQILLTSQSVMCCILETRNYYGEGILPNCYLFIYNIVRRLILLVISQALITYNKGCINTDLNIN